MLAWRMDKNGSTDSVSGKWKSAPHLVTEALISTLEGIREHDKPIKIFSGHPFFTFSSQTLFFTFHNGTFQFPSPPSCSSSIEPFEFSTKSFVDFSWRGGKVITILFFSLFLSSPPPPETNDFSRVYSSRSVSSANFRGSRVLVHFRVSGSHPTSPRSSLILLFQLKERNENWDIVRQKLRGISDFKVLSPPHFRLRYRNGVLGSYSHSPESTPAESSSVN